MSKEEIIAKNSKGGGFLPMKQGKEQDKLKEMEPKLHQTQMSREELFESIEEREEAYKKLTENAKHSQNWKECSQYFF